MNQGYARRETSRVSSNYWVAPGANSFGLIVQHRVLLVFQKLLLINIGLVAFYVIADINGSYAFLQLANLLGPLILGLSALWALRNLLKISDLVVWTPWFWLFGAIILFYSLGPLTYTLGSDVLRSYVSDSLPIQVTPVKLLRTNYLNSVGIMAMLAGMWLAARMVRISLRGDSGGRAVVARMRTLAILLLMVGGVLQFMLILPWEFGAFDFVLPGVIYNLGKLYLFGLMALAYVAYSPGGARVKSLLFILWGVQFMIALIHFSKTEVMITMLLPVLGIYLANRNRIRLLGSLGLMALVFIGIAQMIHFGRYEVISISGNLNHVTIGQRLDIVRRWLAGEGESYIEVSSHGLTNKETAWARLSYSNVQVFAMDQYDAGIPGRSFEMAAYVLIPRIIWPNKPIATDLGVDFYELVVGRRAQTHLGLGLFGEGYWNFGWFGVVFVGLVAGGIFWVIGAYALKWMHQRKLEYMPGVFLGIHMGLLGTTGLFANSVVGGAGFILFYTLFVSRAFAIMLPKTNAGGNRIA